MSFGSVIFCFISGIGQLTLIAILCLFFLCLLLQALVDAPDMVRSQMNFKRLSLTDIKIEINRVPKKKVLIEAMEKAGEDNNFAGI